MIKAIDKLLEVVSHDTWNFGYLESVKSQLEKGYSLSDRQEEIFEKIKKQYSPEAMEEEAQWKVIYGEEQKKIAIICAKYYSTTPYYQDLVLSILNDEDFIPTRKQYRKITENKYAKKILEETFADPKYAVGSMAMLRMGAPRWLARYFDFDAEETKNYYVIVIDNSEGPKTPCKGAKIYNVLPVGGKECFSIEERYLKKARIKKESKKDGNEKNSQENAAGQR